MGNAAVRLASNSVKQLNQTCIVNFWMPDGFKDIPADTKTYRELMVKSLDEIFEAQMDTNYVKGLNRKQAVRPWTGKLYGSKPMSFRMDTRQQEIKCIVLTWDISIPLKM